MTSPPGHHATKSNANGFCIFNFAAAATIFALKKGLKVSVLDWDVHYGQGISDILKEYPNARYASLHQSPAFPYQGTDLEVFGEYQNILTIPVKVYSTWEESFSKSYADIALPFIFTKDTWEPDIIIVCAGYDGMKDDDLANVNLNPEDYAKMVHLLRQRIVGTQTSLAFGLEGGYQLRYDGIRDAVLETVKALLQ